MKNFQSAKSNWWRESFMIVGIIPGYLNHLMENHYSITQANDSLYENSLSQNC
jgi:hypothetical protein